MNHFPVTCISPELNALLGELGYEYDPVKNWVVASPYRFRFSIAGRGYSRDAKKRLVVCRVTVLAPHLEKDYGVVDTPEELLAYFRTMEWLGADASLRTKRLNALIADD